LSKKQIDNNHLYILIIMFSAIFGLYLLIEFLGFFILFVPFVDIILFMAFSAIILALTIFGIKTKSQRTKVSTMVSVILPGLAIAFVTALFFSNFLDSHGNSINIYAYLVFFVVTISCSMFLFFKGIKNLAIKITFGISYCIILAIIVLILILFIISPMPVPSFEPLHAVTSPNEQYIAKLGESAQDDSDDVLIAITRQPRIINLVVVKFVRRSSLFYEYSGDFSSDIYSVDLHWESDYRLVVDLDTPLIFRFEGQNWIRE